MHLVHSHNENILQCVDTILADIYFREYDGNNIASKQLAKYLLRQYLQVEIIDGELSSNKYGKPYFLAYPEFYFSISHAKGILVGACADYPIGIDIEPIRKANLSIIRKVYSQEEKDYVYSSKDLTNFRFTEIWTLKEAYLKCIGTGWTVPIFVFNVLEMTRPDFGFETILINKHMLSICCRLSD